MLRRLTHDRADRKTPWLASRRCCRATPPAPGEIMDVISIVGIVAALFIVISLSEPLAERTRLPYTVVLAIIGAFIGAAAVYVSRYGQDVFGIAHAFLLFDFSIRSNVFLYVLLPTLLFQVSLGVNLRRMADDWVPILVMAVLAVVVATFVIGFALTPFTSLPLMACLMLGAIVATTDPSAVVSIFRNIAAPQRLTRIVEGESLLNDAAAIALFGFFLTFVMMGVPNPTLRDALVEFPDSDLRRDRNRTACIPDLHRGPRTTRAVSTRTDLTQRRLALSGLPGGRTHARCFWGHRGRDGGDDAQLSRPGAPFPGELGLAARSLECALRTGREPSSSCLPHCWSRDCSARSSCETLC